MPMTKAEIRALRRDVKEGSDRSPLFWWLVEHSDEFLREGATERIAWEKHCARFARLGVSDAAGKAPTPATARKTWWRVRKFLAANPPRTNPKAAYPSAQLPAWQPPVVAAHQPAAPAYKPDLVTSRPSAVPPSHAPPNPPAQAETTTSPSQGGAVELTAHAKAELEKLQRMFTDDADG